MAITNESINGIVDTQLSHNQFNSMSAISLISQRLLERSKEDSADVAVNFESPAILRATREIAKMVAFKEKLSDSVSAVSKAKDAINWTKTYLNRAKTDLSNILGSSSSADRTAVATSFDGHLSNIDGKVNGANQLVGFNNINLIGNTEGPDWKTDDIYTPTSNAGGGILEIKGAFLGVDFQVTDTNGLHWRLDAIDKTFYQYSSDGTDKRTGESMPAEGMTIESYDPISGAITYGGTGTLEGTLQRAGLNILTSEYYKNFADDASVQTAIGDIDKALAILNVEGNSIKADAAILEGRIKLVDAKINSFEAEKDLIVSEEVDASNAVTKAADLKLRMSLINLDLLSSASNGLVENMLSLSRGPQKASGLFGLMGY
ncbi:uncharacterized protein METZ01_LOCUS230396 [marine metagenome]|uniref:Flagellin N-terminal domain-containing protein n=1 Tax=marine metagenome TaxID=408172 RepID=A0A382GRP3_9ZZZZ